eukprot:Nitzschia sp. Nitz4//scaffold1_size375055//185340//189218//NITZ4_000274-RA/size375055-processed-gene-0.362-mRNA-1//1//CDS//3329541039//8203//frame0
MMHPNPFSDDLQESGIPMFGKNGTALSQEERASIAKRRGLCLKCGTKTHQVKVLSRQALTNDDVYQGTCIKCNGSSVPANILQAWQARNDRHASSTPVGRFKGVAQTIRYQRSAVAAMQQTRRSPSTTVSTHSAPDSRSLLQRKDSGQPMSSPSLTPSFNRKTISAGASLNVAPPYRNISASSTGSSSHLSTGDVGSQRSMQSLTGLDGEDFKVGAGGDPSHLMQELREHRTSPDHLHSTLHAIRNTGCDEPGFMHELKEIMEIHKADIIVWTLSIGAVWSVASKSPRAKAEAADAGCLPLVLDFLSNDKVKDDANSVYWALGALTSLAELDENKSWMIERGALSSAVDALRRHESDWRVCEWACRALDQILPGPSSPPDILAKATAAVEGAHCIPTVAAALRTHVGESVFQVWASKVLLAIQRLYPESSIEGVAQFLHAEDIVSTFSKVIQSRSVPANVVAQHLETMEMPLIYCATDAVRQQAGECIPVIFRFITERPTDIQLHVSVARFLSVLASGDNQVKRKIADHNGVRLMVKSMMEASNNLELQRSVASLLWMLSGDSSSFDSSMLEEISTAIASASRHNSDDEVLNLAICGYVTNASALALGQSDFVPVDTVMQIFGWSSGNVRVQATWALRVLYAEFPDSLERMDPASLSMGLLEGLRDSDECMQSASCAALVEVLSKSEPARNLARDSGAVATVCTALSACASEQYAVDLLRLLSVSLCDSSSSISDIPDSIMEVLVQKSMEIPRAATASCEAIQNILLAVPKGSKKIRCGGLAEHLCGLLNAKTSDSLAIAACGAIWALCVQQPPESVEVTSQIFGTVLGLCAAHRGEGSEYNGPIVTEGAGALAAVMHCLQDYSISLPEDDIDLIISILDICIEYDEKNYVVFDRFLDVVLSLCFMAKEVLIQFGVIVVVIDCMVESEGNLDIQQKGCAILAMLASTENLQVNLTIAETDGIDMIISALAGFTENEQIQTDSCRALSHLSIDHESRMLISSQGGLMLLVNAMNKYPENVDLLEAASAALLNLTADVEDSVLLSANVVETIVTTMKKHSQSARIQEKSLGVLQNVSMRSKDAKKQISEAGGIEAVTTAIREFMGSPAVLERAFTTTWSLAVLDENQVLFAGDGGVSLVVNGMMANITSEKVQKQACGCLCTLSSNSDNKTLIRDVGGVDAIVYAMWAHYKSDSLLVEACRALSSLAVNIQTNEVMIVSEGEVSAIMSAMRRFPHSEKLQENACVVLRNFLLSADNATIIRRESAELQTLLNHASTRFPATCGDRATQILASIL